MIASAQIEDKPVGQAVMRTEANNSARIINEDGDVDQVRSGEGPAKCAHIRYCSGGINEAMHVAPGHQCLTRDQASVIEHESRTAIPSEGPDVRHEAICIDEPMNISVGQ